MFNCCSHGPLLHFGFQSSRLNICYYHQDLHLRRPHLGPRPRLQGLPQRPSYSRRSVHGGGAGGGCPPRRPLPAGLPSLSRLSDCRQRPGMGPTLQRLQG